MPRMPPGYSERRLIPDIRPIPDGRPIPEGRLAPKPLIRLGCLEYVDDIPVGSSMPGGSPIWLPMPMPDP